MLFLDEHREMGSDLRLRSTAEVRVGEGAPDERLRGERVRPTEVARRGLCEGLWGDAGAAGREDEGYYGTRNWIRSRKKGVNGVFRFLRLFLVEFISFVSKF
jgi:hypothetical protein